MTIDEPALKTLKRHHQRPLRVAKAEGIAVALTVAETHAHKLRELRPRLAALCSELAAAYPASRVTLDWI